MTERDASTVTAKELSEGLAAIERHLPYVKNALALNALSPEKQRELACLFTEMGGLLERHAGRQIDHEGKSYG